MKRRLLRILYWTLGVLAGLIVSIIVTAFVVVWTERVDYPNAGIAFANPLAIPPLLEPTREGNAKVFDLTVQSGATEFQPGVPAATIGFNGAYLGPTIRAARGDDVRIRVRNTLGEPVTVHWHGMDLPAGMDGGPHQLVAAGAAWEPHWTVRNQAATLWYHSHMAGKTGEQVYRGLAGFFLVDDANPAALALPHAYGTDDIPLVVQDRRFDVSGQLVYRHEGFGGGLFHGGMMGDTILVNGTLAPYLTVPATLVRLRILNGSNARRYNFTFADGRPFQQIASDGGLLPAPVERTSLFLAAAERAEIVVDLSDAPQGLKFLSLPFTDPMDPISNLTQVIFFGANDENQQFEILELRTTPAASPVPPLPAVLNDIPRMAATDAVREREFVLDTEADSINGLAHDHMRIDQVVKRGDTEIWLVRNFTSMYHPFHIHGIQFQVLDRNGQPPPAWEMGWKDTVNVGSTETVRLIMTFDAFADPHAPYMFHCHILEHEDMGMMGQFVVVDDLDDESIGIPADTAAAHPH